jgi:hypothetical protein
MLELENLPVRRHIEKPSAVHAPKGPGRSQTYQKIPPLTAIAQVDEPGAGGVALDAMIIQVRMGYGYYGQDMSRHNQKQVNTIKLYTNIYKYV